MGLLQKWLRLSASIPDTLTSPPHHPQNLILPSLLTSITSGLCFWEQEEQQSLPARHGDSVAMEMGLKKKWGIVQRGSDKGSSVLLQRRAEGGDKVKGDTET